MRLATSGIAFAFGCAAVVVTAAQTTPSRGSGSKQSSANISEKITVTGCLEKAEQAALPKTGNTGAEKVAPDAFVLINAGSSTSVQGAAGGTTYVLEGGDGVAAKVGHRVEVKGTAISPATSISAGGLPPPPEPHEAGTVTGGTPGTADTPAATANPRLRVASIRVLGDCSSSR
jgi:hypothetical protein